MEALTYAAGGNLCDVVAGYWSGRWDLFGQAPHVAELLSDPSVHFVFEHRGEHLDNRIVGVWTKLWLRTLEGRGLVRGVKLRAGALRAFVDVPSFRFTNRIVPLSSIFGGSVASLQRAVLGAECDEQAFGAFEEWLEARRVRATSSQVSLAVSLVEQIARDPEIRTVERLAAVGGLCSRALQRLFREYVGASPKWVIRRTRLQEAALRIERGDAATLAELAADLGYTDQAHLSRDFKNAVGRGPSEFARTVWE